MHPDENLPNFRFSPRRWRGIGKMDVAARTVAETIVKTAVTTSGGEDIAPAKTRRTPASAPPATYLLRDPGGNRRVIVPATTLAPISLAETTDVAVTGVQEKKIGIARQNPHFQHDQLHRYHSLHPLSKYYSVSRFLQHIIRSQANPRPKNPPRASQRFRPGGRRKS